MADGAVNVVAHGVAAGHHVPAGGVGRGGDISGRHTGFGTQQGRRALHPRGEVSGTSRLAGQDWRGLSVFEILRTWPPRQRRLNPNPHVFCSWYAPNTPTGILKTPHWDCPFQSSAQANSRGSPPLSASPVLELHALGALRAQLAAHDDLAALGAALHHEAEHAVARPARRAGQAGVDQGRRSNERAGCGRRSPRAVPWLAVAGAAFCALQCQQPSGTAAAPSPCDPKRPAEHSDLQDALQLPCMRACAAETRCPPARPPRPRKLCDPVAPRCWLEARTVRTCGPPGRPAACSAATPPAPQRTARGWPPAGRRGGARGEDLISLSVGVPACEMGVPLEGGEPLGRKLCLWSREKKTGG